MPQSTAADGFDAAALADLLNAAFAAWAIDARAHPAEAGPTPEQVHMPVQVGVHCADGRRLRVQRYEDGSRGLPVWCYGPPDLPLAAGPCAVSLGDLLVDMRMELDGDYAPKPPIAGGSRAGGT